jgi:ribonucleoside-diphosphate reductase beta chain
MEGVNLFGSFCMLLSMSQVGRLPGTVSINQWSIADESIHVRGLCELFRLFIEENPKVVNNHFKGIAYVAVKKVVDLEDAFVDLCYKTGTNKAATPEEIKKYIRFVADYRMQQLGFKPQFGIKENPMPWMDLITSNTFANFFEATSVQYSKNSMTGDWVY